MRNLKKMLAVACATLIDDTLYASLDKLISHRRQSVVVNSAKLFRLRLTHAFSRLTQWTYFFTVNGETPRSTFKKVTNLFRSLSVD